MNKNMFYLEQALCKERLVRVEQIEKLSREVDRLKAQLKVTEDKYNALAQGCIDVYVSEKTIRTDRITVEVVVPAFMSQGELSDAFIEHVKDSVLRARACKFFERREPLK